MRESNAQKRRRRLSRARTIATHTGEEWSAMLELCRGICPRCERSASLEKDHIVPLYQGGSDGLENIQPLCARCNASKGPETVDYRRQGMVEEVREARLA